MVPPPNEVIATKQEVDSLTENLGSLDIDDIAKPLVKTSYSNKLELSDTNTCSKCGKLGHYAKICKFKHNLNKICAEHSDIQNKLITLFEFKDMPEQSSSFYISNKGVKDSSNDLPDNKCINVITTNNNENEFLLELIEQIQDKELKTEYLQKLKGILIKEDSLEPP